MQEHTIPAALDIHRAAREQLQLQGVDLLSKFERLAQETLGLGLENFLNWAVQLTQRPQPDGELAAWLQLQVQTRIAQTCQRCLLPVEVEVQVDRAFRFVATEALAEAQDDGCEEDLLVLSRSFDLAALIEDEVLLALPLIARHEVCPQPVQLSAVDADFEPAGQAPVSPFVAALAGLKPGA